MSPRNRLMPGWLVGFTIFALIITGCSPRIEGAQAAQSQAATAALEQPTLAPSVAATQVPSATLTSLGPTLTPTLVPTSTPTPDPMSIAALRVAIPVPVGAARHTAAGVHGHGRIPALHPQLDPGDEG